MPDIHPDYWGDALIAALPELRDHYAGLQAQMGETPGSNLVFGLVLMPHLVNALHTNDAESASKIFVEMDRIAQHADQHFINMVGVEILEALESKRLLTAASKYFGPRMREIQASFAEPRDA